MLLRMRNILVKVVGKSKHTIIFFSKIMPFITMSKHVVEPKPQTTDDNMAHARRKLDTLGYTHPRARRHRNM